MEHIADFLQFPHYFCLTIIAEQVYILCIKPDVSVIFRSMLRHGTDARIYLLPIVSLIQEQTFNTFERSFFPFPEARNPQMIMVSLICQVNF
jgi:hypothetical protein